MNMTSAIETAPVPADATKRRTVNPAFEAAAVGAKVDIAYERTRFTSRAEGIAERNPVQCWSFTAWDNGKQRCRCGCSGVL